MVNKTQLISSEAAKPKARWIAVDTETTGLDIWRKAEGFAVGICDDTEDGNLTYFEWPVNYLTRKPQYDPAEIAQLKAILEDPTTAKIFHNARFDLRILRKMGINVAGRIEDTGFAARICNTLEDFYGLKPLAKKYFGIEDGDQKELKNAVRKLRLKAKAKGWAIHDSSEADYWLLHWAKKLGVQLEREDWCEIYCLGDVIRTSMLWRMYEEMLDADPYLRSTYDREMKLLKVVMSMEERGLHISKWKTIEQRDYCLKKAEVHKARMREMVSNPVFNPNSPKQLAAVLYGEYRLRITKYSDGGLPSTDWKALRPHQEHAFVRELMMYRSSDKAVDTFFQKYLDIMIPDPLSPGKPDSHVINCSLNQCGTGTGRFSCSDPNLQQVANPESSPRGTDVHARYPFGPRPGYRWYMPDYAQMELRAFASIAKIRKMLEAIERGEDLNDTNTNLAWGGKGNPAAIEAAAHALELGHDESTRDEIQAVWDSLGWNANKSAHGMRSGIALEAAEEWLAKFNYDIVVAEKSIRKKQSRQRGKTIMFIKMYGGGADAAADLLFLPVDETRRFMKQLERPFPEMEDFAKAISAQARQDRFIITKYGRKLHVDPNFAYRAVNYMIQGTCADLMKYAIQRCSDFLKSTGLDAHILMTIHDEIIFEIREDHAYKWVLREICRIMADHEGRLTVPMPVEMVRATESWEHKEVVHL